MCEITTDKNRRKADAAFQRLSAHLSLYRLNRRCVSLQPAKMMMVSEDGMVECEIDSDDGDDEGGGEQINAPPPPPEFASKASTPAPKAPTPPTQPATPAMPAMPATPAPPCPVNRDPYGINQHLKVVWPLTSSLCKLSAVLVRLCLVTALIRQNKFFFHLTYPYFSAEHNIQHEHLFSSHHLFQRPMLFG